MHMRGQDKYYTMMELLKLAWRENCTFDLRFYLLVDSEAPVASIDPYWIRVAPFEPPDPRRAHRVPRRRPPLPPPAPGPLAHLFEDLAIVEDSGHPNSDGSGDSGERSDEDTSQDPDYEPSDHGRSSKTSSGHGHGREHDVDEEEEEAESSACLTESSHQSSSSSSTSDSGNEVLWCSI